MTGLMQFSSSLSAEEQLRLVSISKYSMDELVHISKGTTEGSFSCAAMPGAQASSLFVQIY